MLPETVRQKDLETLYESIMERNNILLTGAFGSGKSYLIKQLKKKLTQRRICISLNMVFLQDWEGFMEKFQKKLSKATKESGPLYMHLKRFLENNPYPLKINAENVLNWLQQFSQSLEQTGTDFLFILKNIDQQGFLGEDEPLLIQNFIRGRTAQLLVSTTSSAYNVKEFEKLHLQPIRAVQIESEPSPALNRLVEISRGNLQLLEELMSRPADRPEESLYELLRRHHRHFLQIQPRFTPMQWNLLKAIALDETVPQPHAFEFLVKHHLGAASSVERALTNLKTTGFIAKTEAGWQLSDVYLLRWMQWIYG